MWWNGQNLEKPIKGVDGLLWHFRVWHDHIFGVYTQRIFFWDEERKNTGFAEFAGDQTLHITKIKQRIRKIVTDSSYRDRFQRQLDFPIERHYS